MDALEIMSNMENVLPYYQPIFSADEHKVVGYEVLGRFALNSTTHSSLGSFFHDEEIPDEFKIEVDDYITKQAIQKILSEEDSDVAIFLNRDAKHLMMVDQGESFLRLLKSFQPQGLELERIIIEISEREFSGDFEQFIHLLHYYKTYGVKIAIDNIGSNMGNWERLSDFSPDILKVDLHKLRNDVGNQSYKDMLYSLSLLARKIGASLLFENIEMDYQLHFAWRNGGRYYQGYYLHKPSPQILNKNILRERLKQKCQDFILFEKRHLEVVYSLAEVLQTELIESISKVKRIVDQDYNTFLCELSKQLGEKYFRLYICDENGFQLTHNVFKANAEWIVQPEYIGKNWSWRPYFLENIMKMGNDKKGLLSDAYSDLETGQVIRTFSYPLGKQRFLFMDLSYEFLFDQDGLLY